MKVAVIYNRESQKVINLFGQPNREKYGLAAIRRITTSLKKGGHQVKAFEGDKDLIDSLEEFMPRTLVGERPGMAFNLSYGIQGQARYTHVPSILEMVGVPYVGSGPLAHSLALDKVVAKMLFVQNGVSTPAFTVLDAPGFELPELNFPLIVKPKNEAVSFGIRIVKNEKELREAADIIFKEFEQPVLTEQYIEGREINVGLLGNGSTLETFHPAELLFGEGGPNIYTEDDKRRVSGREIGVTCPASLEKEITAEAQAVARKAFTVLGCYDCARVDIRMDSDGKLYVLEVNSLPSLGEHGSYVAAAEAMGLDFSALVNRLVEVASARYFGTPNPPELVRTRKTESEKVFAYLTERRDQLEKRIEQWVNISSHSNDPVGIRHAADEISKVMKEVGLNPVSSYSDPPHVWAWESPRGFKNGTLLLSHIDVPFNSAMGGEHFHLDPEWLYGEGIGASRGALVQLEYALRALHRARKIKDIPFGVMIYADEGRDCEESAEFIEKAAEEAKAVLVLRPANTNNSLVVGRRGQRRYRAVFRGQPRKLGQAAKHPEVMLRALSALEDIAQLNDRKARLAVSTVNMHTHAYPRLLPHRVDATLQASFPNIRAADQLEERIRNILAEHQAELALLSDRLAMPSRRINNDLLKSLRETAKRWEIPLNTETSLWPSVAGLVPPKVPVICGMGPEARALYTGQEAVSRISIVQRTLLLAEYLLNGGKW
ncbi:MAG: ATP-grasp domain-containing protein [Candidatus Thiodiazotropha sp. (ex. Lucinisca nassula)]|nr:ATP-grasp domain-containing protein [Candidatus Thiodiazotropha sp. (ex. Lucinisca nassula)]MBW9268567.1 ATP-grasp domain-containing protein [Candidatus Thiodiazotropha sp. (ex. Lucinisca nassula)]